MAELLIQAVNNSHPDPEKDQRGCWKRGMPVAVMDDGHEWGSQERLPKFAILKLPGVAKERVQKYIADYLDVQGEPVRRRLWQIRWADLPLAARQKLAGSGELTIKVGSYSGQFDYTWTQIKGFFRNLSSATDETEEL